MPGRGAGGRSGPDPRSPASKVLARADAVARAGPGRPFRLVFTNGCFDLLHRGHVACLARARSMGDALLVAVNSDASARRLGKGPGRPLVDERSRAEVVAALECVDMVVLFDEDTPEALVAELAPDVLVKGGDYDADEVAGGDVVRARGGRVEIVPLVGGCSTSAIVERIRGGGPREVLLATRSAHKVREVRRILGARWRIVTPDEAGVPWSPREEELEPHDTFEENAESKARYFAALTGLPTVADDSGLEVDALDGRPGVRSRRFAPAERYPGVDGDEANNRHLLALLEGVPEPERGARYVCVACVAEGEVGGEGGATGPRGGAGEGVGLAEERVAGPGGGPGVRFFRGESEGRILDSPRGSGGFGYDPLFFDDELGRSYAELTPDEKHARSHRGRAFRALARYPYAASMSSS